VSRGRIVLAVVALLVLAAVIYGWMLSRRGFSARDEPSLIETLIARGARNLATPARAKRLENPVPRTEEGLREGMEHFADHCAICHANDGSGDAMFGRNMYPPAPDMRAVTQELADGEIYYIIRNGIRLTGMPAFGEGHDEQDRDTWNLVHFIRHLPDLTPEEEAEMRRFNPISRADLEQQIEIERFLAGEADEPPATPRRHDHQH
jgi:mono/diheme cytochrome c family protein